MHGLVLGSPSLLRVRLSRVTDRQTHVGAYSAMSEKHGPQAIALRRPQPREQLMLT